MESYQSLNNHQIPFNINKLHNFTKNHNDNNIGYHIWVYIIQKPYNVLAWPILDVQTLHVSAYLLFIRDGKKGYDGPYTTSA